MTLSGVTSLAKLFLLAICRTLADACGTLGFRRTPVENHCHRGSAIVWLDSVLISSYRLSIVRMPLI